MSATFASRWAHLLGVSLVVCALAAVLHPTSIAHAQDEEAVSESLDSAARALFLDGRRAFESGDFETALARFQQAYDISHRVPLLWNIATTLDRLRRDEEALRMFEQYIAAAPEAGNRSEVEGRIRVLREAVEARHAETAAREEEARRLEEERRRLEEERAAGGGGGGDPVTPSGGGGITPVVFIVAAGLTAVAGGVLIWSGIDTLTANDNYVRSADAAPLATVESLYASALDAQLRTNILVGVTGALAATAVILAIFTDWDGDPPADSPASAPAASLLPIVTTNADGSLGGAGLVLRGSF